MNKKLMFYCTIREHTVLAAPYIRHCTKIKHSSRYCSEVDYV